MYEPLPVLFFSTDLLPRLGDAYAGGRYAFFYCKDHMYTT